MECADSDSCLNLLYIYLGEEFAFSIYLQYRIMNLVINLLTKTKKNVIKMDLRVMICDIIFNDLCILLFRIISYERSASFLFIVLKLVN